MKTYMDFLNKVYDLGAKQGKAKKFPCEDDIRNVTEEARNYFKGTSVKVNMKDFRSRYILGYQENY